MGTLGNPTPPWPARRDGNRAALYAQQCDRLQCLVILRDKGFTPQAAGQPAAASEVGCWDRAGEHSAAQHSGFRGWLAPTTYSLCLCIRIARLPHKHRFPGPTGPMPNCIERPAPFLCVQAGHAAALASPRSSAGSRPASATAPTGRESASSAGPVAAQQPQLAAAVGRLHLGGGGGTAEGPGRQASVAVHIEQQWCNQPHPLSSSFCLSLPCLLSHLRMCPWCRRAHSSGRDTAAVAAGAESAPGSGPAQPPPAGTFQALTALLGRCMAAGALDAVSLGKFLLQSKAEGPAAQQQTLEVLGVVEAGGGLAAVGEVVRQELARAGGSGGGQ